MALTKISGGVIQQPVNIGIVTATNINVSGAITASSAIFTGDVSIGGTITYEDVTNVDSVGLITARSGIHVTGGSVGIGTDNPGNSLHLYKSGGDAILEIENTGNGNHSGIFFVRESIGGVNKGAANIHVESNTSGSGTALVFGCGSNINATGSERLRIDQSGNIGIGSTQPTAKLDIFHSSNSESTAFFKNGGGSAPATVHIWEDNSSSLHYGLFVGKEDYTNPVLVTKKDKIGIGTDDPKHNLHLYNNGDATLFIQADADNVDEDHNPKISMSQDGLTSSIFDIGINGTAGDAFTGALANTAYLYSVSNASSNGIQFATNGAARMYLNNSGNLGIGTDDPTHPVTISVNASGSQDALFITNKNTATNNTANIIFGPSNGVAGGRISCIAVEDFGASGERTADFMFETRKDGTFEEALRIKNDGRILNTLGNAPYATSAKYRFYARYSNPAIAVEGTGSSYCEGAFVTIAPTNYRGGGLFMYNDNDGGTPIEWFAGRPYSAADQFIIARKSNPTGIGEDTAQYGNKLLVLTNGGNMTINGTLTQSGSDDKLKTNRVGITSALEKVKTLEGFTYNWNDDAINNYGFSADDGTLVGMSAQELQLVLPEAVKNISVYGEVEDPTSGEVGERREYLTIQYERVVPLLVQALKELSENNDALEERITALENP
jgi:hypothetical protein